LLGIALEREIEQRAEIRIELVGPVSEELLEPAPQADADAQLRLVGSCADPLGPQQVAEGPVRERLPVRDAPPLEPAHAGVLRAGAQLGDEARLADAGIAAHEEDAAASGPERVERLSRRAELAGAPDEM